MRHLECPDDHAAFYLDRGDYYGSVDFDDGVYRAYRGLSDNAALVPPYELVLVDEFQDLNAMEGGIIGLLAGRSAVVIAGDDDQALYSRLRQASWDHIRAHYYGDEYDVFELPFYMRCTEVIVDAVNDGADTLSRSF
ncbi:MAG: UvrD-helicase domain-containing protein [Gammaproteobacteria bacterium]|nr:UvrD-helicase domain-containing protein [Gammaproteobacteria bacterium]